MKCLERTLIEKPLSTFVKGNVGVSILEIKKKVYRLTGHTFRWSKRPTSPYVYAEVRT